VSFFNVELSIVGGRGGDFATDANGQPSFDLDTFTDDSALRGDIIRMLLQNPRLLSSGVYIGEPDDPYHADDGAGLAQLVDKLYTPEFQAAVEMQVLEGLATMPTVLDDPSPTVQQSISEKGLAAVDISYTRITGETRSLPTIFLNITGG
jgi:hypothetical protein